jgi:adsorption protein B
MDLSGEIFAALQVMLRETTLFAACGFLLLGAGDLAVDFVWIGLWIRRRLRRTPRDSALSLAAARAPGAIAVFIPAWDESAVIGGMLAHARQAFGEADYLLYVGCYPNDPATIAAVEAAGDSRVRCVVGPRPGPTSKADCLNQLWQAMRADEARRGRRFKAVVLHDAEDVVHSAECNWTRTVQRVGGRDLVGSAGMWGDGNGGFPGFPPRSGGVIDPQNNYWPIFTVPAVSAALHP